MVKEKRKILRQLKKEKKYEEIFKQFGQKEFTRSVDKKYKEKDIEKLKREGKFEDIYLRYGESEYNSLLKEIRQREIEEVYGKKSFRANWNKIKNNIKSTLYIMLYSIGSFGIQQGVGQIGATVIESELIKNENKKEYEDLIKEYEERS